MTTQATLLYSDSKKSSSHPYALFCEIHLKPKNIHNNLQLNGIYFRKGKRKKKHDYVSYENNKSNR